MKNLTLSLSLFVALSGSAVAQSLSSTASNERVTDQVLKELSRERALLSQNLDFRIKEIDSKINNLDETCL